MAVLKEKEMNSTQLYYKTYMADPDNYKKHLEANKRYYEKNREKVLARVNKARKSKVMDDDAKKLHNEKMKKYYKDNKDKIKAKRKKRYEEKKRIEKEHPQVEE